MSSDIFQSLVLPILSSTTKENFTFILHGGEPTLLPIDWFEENLSYAYSVANQYGKSLTFNIQSNLIDISEEKLDTFARLNISIGGSLDNPAFLKGMQRPLAEKALNTYLKAKNMGIKIGILTTINSSNINSTGEFCDWLLHSLDVHHFKANIAYPVGVGFNQIALSAEAIFLSQKAMIEFMVETNAALVEEHLSLEIIRFFENYLGGKTRSGSLCDDKRCGAGSKVVGVGPDGQLFPCGRFAWDNSQHSLGNLYKNKEQETSDYLEKYNSFQDMHPENWLACGTCEAAVICSFGCQAFIVRSKTKINIECNPTKLRFAYYQEHSHQLQKLYEQLCEKQRMPAMSWYNQKLSKLKQFVSPEYYPLIQHELTKALEDQVETMG